MTLINFPRRKNHMALRDSKQNEMVPESDTLSHASFKSSEEPFEEPHSGHIAQAHDFTPTILSLAGKRSHEAREFMSRLRAQQMSQAYEQAKESHFELNKLPAVAHPAAPSGKVNFGPCMTFKQAEEQIQMMRKSKEVQASQISKRFNHDDKENGADRLQLTAIAGDDKKFTHQTMNTHAKRYLLGTTKHQETGSTDSNTRKIISGRQVQTANLFYSSDISVASTQPESPMSCCDDLSVFC